MPVKEDKPITLSGIIPPPSHVRSISDGSILIEDDSVLKSVFANASDFPEHCMYLDSEHEYQAMGDVSDIIIRTTTPHELRQLQLIDLVCRGFEASKTILSTFALPLPLGGAAAGDTNRSVSSVIGGFFMIYLT